jgi:hypothetical protein
MKNARLIRTCFVKNGGWLIAAVAACVWANWDYKGGFGIIARDGQGDEGFIKVLIGSRAAKDR